MSMNIHKPYPMRITFLRDQYKVPEEEKQQKISVTFLSSLIQQERKNNRNINSMLITATNLDNQQQPQRTESPPPVSKTTYQKWKIRKSVSHSEDKRLLTNLIGPEWTQYATQGQLGIKNNKKNMRNIIREKTQTISEEGRHHSNRKLMENHFKSFLSDKKQKPYVAVEALQPKCITTKIDERMVHSLKPNYMFTLLHAQPHMKNKAERIVKYESKQSNKIKTKKSKSKNNNESTEYAKNNQKLNFKWSRLNQDQKFILNDSS